MASPFFLSLKTERIYSASRFVKGFLTPRSDILKHMAPLYACGKEQPVEHSLHQRRGKWAMNIHDHIRDSIRYPLRSQRAGSRLWAYLPRWGFSEDGSPPEISVREPKTLHKSPCWARGRRSVDPRQVGRCTGQSNQFLPAKTKVRGDVRCVFVGNIWSHT